MFYITNEGVIYLENGGVVAQDQNPLHQEYLAWIEEGNTPGEWTDGL
jgi:hypothetical protein